MNKYLRVTKNFNFDMAHALYGYDGPCANIHGHTYHLSVSILGKPINDPFKSENGMVIDFGDIKKIVKENIIDVYDHSLILNKDASYA